MANFETVAQQSKLKPRKAPYWRRLSVGHHIGIRKTDAGTHWQAKAYDPASQKESIKSLGDFGHLPPHERFSAASKAAQEWFDHLGKGGRRDSLTVKGAWLRYIAHQRKAKGVKAAEDAEGRFKRYVENDPIAGLPVEKLAKRHLQEWRDRLTDKPAMQPKRGPNCRVKSPQKESQPRSASAVNRDMVPMRAALNLAFDDGYVTSSHAWRLALKPKKNAGGRRTLYLDRDQRRALIEQLPEDAAAFVRGLCVLPLRPGALAALTVANFDSRQGTLSIGIDKAGKDRSVLLPKDTTAMLRAHAKGRLPTAPLLARWNGSAWNKDAWKDPIKDAARAAGLPEATTAYTLRHSVITDLVTSGLDLFTISVLAGTSVVMIEKHYGHLQQKHAQAALAALAL